MSELQQTLMDLVHTRNSVTGYEMEQIVKSALDSLDDEEARIAEELREIYFSANTTSNYKPLKFVYYRIVKPKQRDEYSLRRNLYLSPRATGYFSKEDPTTDGIRELMRTKESILGSDLKKLVIEAKDRDWEFPTRESSQEEIADMSYRNLSKQLAEYIFTYFIDCEKAIKDDIWYGVSCKEYATATVYRDLNKSPRG